MLKPKPIVLVQIFVREPSHFHKELLTLAAPERIIPCATRAAWEAGRDDATPRFRKPAEEAKHWMDREMLLYLLLFVEEGKGR